MTRQGHGSEKASVPWQYYFARKFSLQRFEIVLRVFISDFYWQHFRVRLQNMLIKPEQGGNHAIWMDAREYEHAVQNIFAVVTRNLATFHFYRRMIERVEKVWVRAAHDVARAVRKDMTNRQLGKLYDRFLHWHQEHFNKPIWIIFPIEPLIVLAVERALRRVLSRTKRAKDFDHWLQVIFTPEEQNAINAAQEALLRGALRIHKRTTSVEKTAAALAKRFGFIPCYDVVDAPWDQEHFAQELRRLLKKDRSIIEQEMRSIREQYRKSRDAFAAFLQRFAMTKKERELFIMAHEFVFIKDDRDDHRRQGSYYGRRLFAEIGRRLSVSQREAAYMSISETRDFLFRSIKPDTAKILERVRGYVLLRKHGKPYRIASGEEAQVIIRQEIGTTIPETATSVHGTVGAAGFAKGHAVIVHTKHDLRRVKDGAVMIAVTTNPDYVPAMRRCSAIVTDEGGLTAHAAIVARELNKPCIVGTKVATRVFQDGDLVAVDAKRGMVRKVR